MSPPVTQIKYVGDSVVAGGKTYISPETQVYFIAQDQSPVSIFYSITNSAFIPAYPFSIRNPGEYLIQYYATDNAGNRETNHSAILVVGVTAPQVAQLDLVTPSVAVSGDLLFNSAL